jgi:peroxiredoxin Q/BCP
MLHKLYRRISLMLGAFIAIMVLFTQSALGLEVGASAADFSLQASDGNTYTLSQFIGDKPVVIAFFPKAFTGG